METIVISLPRFSCIAAYKDDKSKRLIILKESISSTELLEVPEDLRNWVFQQEDIQIINYDVHLDYDYYTASEVCVFINF